MTATKEWLGVSWMARENSEDGEDGGVGGEGSNEYQ